MSKLQRYGFAILCAGLSLALGWGLDAPVSSFFLAVIVSIYGGKGPGLLSAGLAIVAFDYFFLPPHFYLFVHSESYLRFTLFAASLFLVIWIIEARRKADE